MKTPLRLSEHPSTPGVQPLLYWYLMIIAYTIIISITTHTRTTSHYSCGSAKLAGCQVLQRDLPRQLQAAVPRKHQTFCRSRGYVLGFRLEGCLGFQGLGLRVSWFRSRSYGVFRV